MFMIAILLQLCIQRLSVKVIKVNIITMAIKVTNMQTPAITQCEGLNQVSQVEEDDLQLQVIIVSSVFGVVFLVLLVALLVVAVDIHRYGIHTE